MLATKGAGHEEYCRPLHRLHAMQCNATKAEGPGHGHATARRESRPLSLWLWVMSRLPDRRTAMQTMVPNALSAAPIAPCSPHRLRRVLPSFTSPVLRKKDIQIRVKYDSNSDGWMHDHVLHDSIQPVELLSVPAFFFLVTVNAK